MAHFDDAKELVDHAKEQLIIIEQEYHASISAKKIKHALLISIKNFMENLRSALDYTAHGLFDKYGTRSAKKKKIYFPYASINQTLDEFRKCGRVENNIPGISAKRPDIVAKIESYQHFSSKENEWLPIFMELNNQNKHQELSPQIRKETKELRITTDRGGVSLKGAKIKGHGSIVSGNTTIPVRGTVDAENPPVLEGSGKVEVITWVSFHFKSNNQPVQPLLQAAFVV